jgi:hypothetical protein
MRAFLPILGLVFTQLCLEASETNAVATGDWSEPVGGLHARLLVYPNGQDRPPQRNAQDWSRLAKVYVEFENVSESLDPMQIRLDGHLAALRCQLLDGSGNAPPEPGMGFGSAPVIRPYWLLLPFDSSLKVRADNLWGIPKPGERGLSLSVGPHRWLIPDGSPTNYFLSGTFTVPEPSSLPERSSYYEHPSAWSGALKLPRVKLPAPTPKP